MYPIATVLALYHLARAAVQDDRPEYCVKSPITSYASDIRRNLAAAPGFLFTSECLGLVYLAQKEYADACARAAQHVSILLASAISCREASSQVYSRV
jgi:hypothetical protein